jgi:hypothetical protein
MRIARNAMMASIQADIRALPNSLSCSTFAIASRDDAEASDEEPGDGAFEGSLPILGEPSGSAGPCEGAFDGPALGENLKALGDAGSAYDHDCPVADFRQCAAQPGADMATVSEETAAQP